MLAGTFGWNPIAGIDYYLSIPPPDIIPDSVSRYLAETLNRVVPDLPERSGKLMELRNYFGGERKGVVEEFVRLCQLGDLTVRRRLQSEL